MSLYQRVADILPTSRENAIPTSYVAETLGLSEKQVINAISNAGKHGVWIRKYNGRIWRSDCKKPIFTYSVPVGEENAVSIQHLSEISGRSTGHVAHAMIMRFKKNKSVSRRGNFVWAVKCGEVAVWEPNVNGCESNKPVIRVESSAVNVDAAFYNIKYALLMTCERVQRQLSDRPDLIMSCSQDSEISEAIKKLTHLF